MTLAAATGMVLRAMSTPEMLDLLGPAVAPANDLLAQLQADRSRLPVLFPGLPRRFGKAPIGGGIRKLGDATIDLDALRTCDLVAAHLLASIAATADEVADVYDHGDIEERVMLLRSLSFLPLGSITQRLFGEVLRTNVVLHLEAAMCDSDLLSRAITNQTVDAETANRLLLKFAFLDMDLTRALQVEAHANVTLSTMLQDLATEREAAGRSVWRHTNRLLGRAPCPGALGRLIGGLEHGDDGVRQAAATGLLSLTGGDHKHHQAMISQFANERLPREPRAAIRELLQQLASN